jgi:aryl-alcohol dehydrogenase-like predicted oxidoreductase
MLDVAQSARVSTIDTARSYGDGEAIIGKLADRAHWTIVTKLAADIDAGNPDVEEALRRTQLSVMDSRRALGADRLDSLLLHRGRHRIAWGGAVWNWLLERRTAGEIKHLGVSAACPEEALLAVEADGVEIIQVATSLLDQRLARLGFFARASERSVKVFVRSAYLQGAVFKRPHELPQYLKTIGPHAARIRRWAAQREIPAEAPYLLYIRSLGGIPVVGVEQHFQVTAAVDALAADCDPSELRALARSIPTFDAKVLNPASWPSHWLDGAPREATSPEAR